MAFFENSEAYFLKEITTFAIIKKLKQKVFTFL